ncbi:MAG: ABC transporter substrate-binding protein [Coriobacteriales bacterium]|nr:ABC transporter substrate-binding protein [Coriobacteriales bacterium]
MSKRILSIILSAVLVSVLLLAGCSSAGAETTTDTGQASAICITDMMGRTVALEKPAEKVVVLTASACEIVYALGAGDTIIGRGEYCDWPVEALAKPSLASGSETNIEQIIALRPDLVLMATMDQTPEQVEQIQKAGIAVYSSEAHTIASTYESILQIGTLMGKDAEAQQIVGSMKATFEALAAHKVTGTVYFEVSPLENGLWAAGNNTFLNEVAELIGLENIFADVDSWAEVSEEQVLKRNPDYIVTLCMYYGTGLTPVEEILQRASWQNVAAVKNARVFNLSNNELARPAPRLAEGTQALYEFIKANS